MAAWHYPAVHCWVWRGSDKSLWHWEEKGTMIVWGQVRQEGEPQSQDIGSVLGLQELEAGNFPTALSLLQEAAGGFCSKKMLAQIYTCLGCCAQRMVMPAERGKAAVGWGGSGWCPQCLRGPKPPQGGKALSRNYPCGPSLLGQAVKSQQRFWLFAKYCCRER